jgi:hypothetical protein
MVGMAAAITSASNAPRKRANSDAAIIRFRVFTGIAWYERVVTMGTFPRNLSHFITVS